MRLSRSILVESGASLMDHDALQVASGALRCALTLVIHRIEAAILSMRLRKSSQELVLLVTKQG